MQNKDNLERDYMSVNERFADAVNAGVFCGRRVILPEQIQEIDTVANYTLKSKKSTSNEYGQQYRDILKTVIHNTNFCMIGIENQSKVHYVFPVRNMLYDAASYKKQWNRIQREHRKKKDLKDAEFLSGFSKDDRLQAVITLVVYFGTEEWDGAKDIHSLIDWSDIPEEFKAAVPNYSIYLLELNKYENLDDFQSDLKTVCRFLQNCNDDKKLENMLKEHRSEFENMEEDTYDLIGELGNMSQIHQLKKECKKEEGKYDMCKGMDDWLERKKKEGMDEGARIKLREQIEKKLRKGKTAEAIADELEENIQTVLELMEELS